MADITYQALERSISTRLQAAGIEAGAFEARLLVMAASDMNRAALISAGDECVSAEVWQRCEMMTAERIERRPLQHILGTTEFYGLEFLCDPRALIPRPDSEVVVEAALNLMADDFAGQVADLGTGSGCLLAAILSQRSLARGVGVDASPDAVSLAKENIDRLSLADRAEIFHGSWTEWNGWEEADLIISNPPYIPSGDIPGLAPEVQQHDPMSALDGGADGLEAYREILSLASGRMKPGGWLVFEIGFDQRAAVCDLLFEGEFTNIGSAKDLGGNDRAVWGRKSGG